MKATMPYGPRDVRYEDRPDPKIIEPTDAIIKLSAACVCGSDLWPYRGIDLVKQSVPMQGLRLDPAPGTGGGGLPRDG